MRHVIAIFLSLGILCSCTGTRNAPKYELGNGIYDFRQKDKRYRNVHVYVQGDTLSLFRDNQLTQRVTIDPLNDQIYMKRNLDVDVMTIAFKYRPATLSLPRQLNTDFNGNIYLGYRFDRFKIKMLETPIGLQKSYRHRGFTLGTFGGIGSTAVTPWTTNNRITDEYNGLILTRGLALMVAVNNLTVGMGIGWDALTDRDKHLWIYQNKPWYGLTVGLNIN
jgi:hypothetical protein